MTKNWLDPFIKASKVGSQEELADLLNVSRATINRLANDHKRLRRTRAEAMAPLLNVDANDLMLNRPPPKGKLVESFDPDQSEPEFDPDWQEQGAALVDGKLAYERKFEGGSPEVAATPGLGLGRIDDDRAARVVSNGIATGHPVLNEWVIPPSYIRNALDATPSQILVMPVIGHSMEPLLKSNDRVLVDISQNTWVGDAVYVIDDGDTVLRAKTIKKVTASKPAEYRIISEASPDDIEILGADKFRIVGRVVGRFTRM